MSVEISITNKFAHYSPSSVSFGYPDTDESRVYKSRIIETFEHSQLLRLRQVKTIITTTLQTGSRFFWSKAEFSISNRFGSVTMYRPLWTGDQDTPDPTTSYLSFDNRTAITGTNEMVDWESMIVSSEDQLINHRISRVLNPVEAALVYSNLLQIVWTTDRFFDEVLQDAKHQHSQQDVN